MPRGRPKTSVDITLVCAACRKKFVRPDYEARRGAKFCSRACFERAGPHRKRPPIPPGVCTCRTCGKTFEVGGRGRRKRTSRYCSRSCAGAARGMPISQRQRVCQCCRKTFEIYGAHSGKFCSRRCFYRARGARKRYYSERSRQCTVCGKTFLLYGAHTGKYCGRRCYLRGRKGQPNPGAAKRPGYYLYGGYRWVRIVGPRHGRSGKFRRGRVQEHVLIAETALGRRLKKGEVVHHFNLVKLDNRHANLLICGQDYHRMVHDRMAQAWAREHLVSAA